VVVFVFLKIPKAENATAIPTPTKTKPAARMIEQVVKAGSQSAGRLDRDAHEIHEYEYPRTGMRITGLTVVSFCSLRARRDSAVQRP